MALYLDHCDMSDPYVVAAVNAARRELDEAQPRLPQWLLAQLPYMEEADLRRVEEMQQRESQAAEEKRRRLEPQLQARIDAVVTDREKAQRLEDRERAAAKKRVDPYLLAEENARRRGEIASPKVLSPEEQRRFDAKTAAWQAEARAVREASRPAPGPVLRIDQVDMRGLIRPPSMAETEAARLRLQRAEMEKWRV